MAEDEKIALMDGRLHVYRRPRSRYWQCSTFLLGRNHRVTTKEESATLAKEFAVEWYMELYAASKRRQRGEELPAPSRLLGGDVSRVDRRRRPTAGGPTFKQAADAFIKEFATIVGPDRNERYVDQKEQVIRLRLLPFFETYTIAEVNAGLIASYRVHRLKPVEGKDGKSSRPSQSTIHKELVALRQILKTANRKGWISALPDMTAPYKTSGKVSHRAWFNDDEYKRLVEALRERVANPPKPRWKPQIERFRDYVLFMANTGLRPDEASRLQFRDVKIVEDDATGETILLIEVRGKRGVGFCKSTAMAVHPFERLRDRAAKVEAAAAKRADDGSLKPTTVIFGPVQRQLLNKVLDELDLKFDREGRERTAYSFRHTYISKRLNEGADIYQIAKNCRTSVEMIEKFYARHIQNSLDAGAINTRKPKRRPAAKRKPKTSQAAE